MIVAAGRRSLMGRTEMSYTDLPADDVAAFDPAELRAQALVLNRSRTQLDSMADTLRVPMQEADVDDELRLLVDRTTTVLAGVAAAVAASIGELSEFVTAQADRAPGADSA